MPGRCDFMPQSATASCLFLVSIFRIWWRATPEPTRDRQVRRASTRKRSRDASKSYGANTTSRTTPAQSTATAPPTCRCRASSSCALVERNELEDSSCSADRRWRLVDVSPDERVREPGRVGLILEHVRCANSLVRPDADASKVVDVFGGEPGCIAT